MIFLHSLLREDPLLHGHLDRGPDGGQHVEEDCGQEYTTASTERPAWTEQTERKKSKIQFFGICVFLPISFFAHHPPLGPLMFPLIKMGATPQANLEAQRRNDTMTSVTVTSSIIGLLSATKRFYSAIVCERLLGLTV